MNDLLGQWVLLAEAEATTGAPDPATPPASPGGNPFGFAVPLMIILVLGYMMLVRPEKKKQSIHREMLANLKKNDRIVTVGGIKGIVSNVLREANEVTVTIDESTGTKVRMTIDSIARVESAKSEKTEEEKK